MQVKDIMSGSVELANPDTSIREIARRMKHEDIGALPVGENDRLVGMITDRDIVTRAVAEGRSPDMPIRDIMSNSICYCFEDQDADEAAGIMASEQVRRLPVLDRNKRLVGMVALADISLCQPDSAKIALQGISEPTPPSRGLH